MVNITQIRKERRRELEENLYKPPSSEISKTAIDTTKQVAENLKGDRVDVNRVLKKLEEEGDTAAIMRKDSLSRQKKVAEEPDESFLSRITSPSGIATLAAAGISMAAGESAGAGGLALGAVIGADKSARAMNLEKELRISRLGNEALAAGQQAISAYSDIFGTQTTQLGQQIAHDTTLYKLATDYIEGRIGEEHENELTQVMFENGLIKESVLHGYRKEYAEDDFIRDMHKIDTNFKNSLKFEEFSGILKELRNSNQRAWQSAENALQKVHEKEQQGARLSHDQKMRIFESEVKKYLQEDSQEHQLVMLAADQAFTREERIASEEYGFKKQKLEQIFAREQLDAEMMHKYVAWAMSDPAFFAKVAKDNPELREFVETKYRHDPIKLGKYKKEVETEIAQQDMLLQGAAAAIESGNLKGALDSLSAAGIKGPGIKEAVSAVVTNQSNEDLENLYSTLLPYMSEMSIAASGKMKAQGRDMIEVINALDPKINIQQYEIGQIEQRKVVMAKIWEEAANRLPGEYKTAENFLSDVLSKDDMSILEVTGGVPPHLLERLMHTDYNIWQRGVQQKAAELISSKDKRYQGADGRQQAQIDAIAAYDEADRYERIMYTEALAENYFPKAREKMVSKLEALDVSSGTIEALSGAAEVWFNQNAPESMVGDPETLIKLWEAYEPEFIEIAKEIEARKAKEEEAFDFSAAGGITSVSGKIAGFFYRLFDDSDKERVLKKLKELEEQD
jgi:hypothetical protein